MTTQTLGAQRRPRLSPRYGRKAETGSSENRPGVLSTLELRRLVAEMID